MDSSGTVKSFSVSNAKGYYQLAIPLQSVNSKKIISVSLLGYKTQKTIADNKKINFILSKEYIFLKEVKVQQKRISTLRNDTLNFNVENLSVTTDRVIGDILRRIPGLSIENTGKIFFNGKPIKNLYINGDNLLDDKYNIATTAIPNNIVEEIQIIPNDQPIKVLSGIIFSETPSINLKIKSKFSTELIGRGEAGINASGDHDLDIYTMLFKKNMKTLNSVKANNIGFDLLEEITPHNITDYLKTLEHESPASQVDIKDFAYPSIAKEKYFFNNDKLINFNILLKDKKQTEFKSNFSLLRQGETENIQNSLFYFIPQDTISYYSNTGFHQSLNQLNASINIKRNIAKSYISNTIQTKFFLKKEVASINNNNEFINEYEKVYNSNFSNDFNFIRLLKNDLLFEINSFSTFYEIPQSIQITPGIFPNILNNNINYLENDQRATVKAFFFNNNISVKKIQKRGNLSLMLKYIFDNESFTSLLQLKQMNGGENLGGNMFANDVPWIKNQLSFELNKISTIGRLTYNIMLPLDYYRYQFSNHTYSNFNKNKIIFNPQLNFRLKVGLESDISLSFRYYSKSPSPANSYDGYILQSYRAFSANFSNTVFSNTKTLTFSYNFKKNVQLLFANVLISISKSNPEQIFYRKFEDNLQFYGYKNFDSSFSNFFIDTRISKYLFKIQSTISGEINVVQNSIAQLQNDNIVNFLNTSFNATFKINSKINDWLNTSYKIIFSRSNSNNLNNSKNESNLLTFTNQTLEVNSSFTDRLLANVNFDAYNQKVKKNNYSKNIFLDAGITYKINKYKADLNLTATNLLNEKEYISVSNSNNLNQISTFRIRPRMIFFKLFFNF